MTTATWTIVGYLGLVTLLGAWLSRRNRSSADWATGSGGMGIAMIAAGIACIFGYFVGTASVLEWLLLGFAMVVPPAIAIAYIFGLHPLRRNGRARPRFLPAPANPCLKTNAAAFTRR